MAYPNDKLYLFFDNNTYHCRNTVTDDFEQERHLMAGTTLRAVLDTRHAADRCLIPSQIDELLKALELTGADPGPDTSHFAAKVKIKRDITLLGFASFALDPGLDPIDAEVTVNGPVDTPTGFRIDVTPGDRLKLPMGINPARVQVDGDRQTLVEEGVGPVRVTGEFAIRIEGATGSVASLRIVVPGSPDAVVTVLTHPSAILFGDSGFGLELAQGIVIDDSTSEAPPPIQPPPPQPPASAADSWRGIVIRHARLFLPAGTPLLGGVPLDVALELGRPIGLDAHAAVNIPAQNGRPAMQVTIEWHDPAAASLTECLPTSIEVIADFPIRDRTVPVGGQAVTLLGGDPLRVRGRFARDPRTSPPRMTFSLAVEGGGEDGLIAIDSTGNQPAAKIFVTAACLAAAFMTDADRHDAPSGDATGTTLSALLLAATAISSFFTDDGRFVVHGIEVGGDVAPAGEALRLKVDYSVDVVVTPINVGVLSVSVDPKVPMRVRYRNVVLEIDFAAAGLDRFHLSYDQAEFGVEDPGKWLVQGPGSIFDVIGTRSGHGSVWFEIDLRFALDLGPLKVSGATVRATLNDGAPRVTLRGLEARVDLPGLLQGSGLSSLNEHGIDLALAGTIVPLQVGALAFASYEDTSDFQGHFQKILLGVAVDLPGAIPLANTGLGIYGLLGVFGINGTFPQPPDGADPVEEMLQWRPWQPGAIVPERGSIVFGFGAVLGTVPDLGYAFSAKALIVLTVPDLALRATLDGRFMTERAKFAEMGTPPPVGLRLLGMLAADAGGLTLGLRGTYTIPRLLEVVVPFGAHFPTSGSEWYVHLGSDGFNGRGPGPIEVRVLPDLFNLVASAYFMARGAGIPNFAGLGKNLEGFAIGFGFSWQTTTGFAIIRLDLSASAAVGLGSHPLMFIGHGGLRGTLHLGPVSIGVSADVDLQVGPTSDDKWAHFRICGEVDLFFFSISGCVELSIGKISDIVPNPGVWPLERVTLTDRTYSNTVDAATDPSQAPTVWPDCLPILSFTTGPASALTSGPFHSRLSGTAPGGWNNHNGGDGSYGSYDLRYTYRLSKLELIEIDPATGAETPMTEPLDAAWQLPKHGSTTGTATLPGARELALLSWKPHHWMHVLPDGGKNLPHDPLPGLTNHCRLRWEAVPAWALGSQADRDGWGEPWSLATEPPGLLRFAGEFEVIVSATCGRLALDELSVYGQNLPLGFDLGGPVSYGDLIDAAGRSFTGGLAFPRVIGATFDAEDSLNGWLIEQPIVVDLTFSPVLVDPHVVLVVDPKPVPDVVDRIEVTGFLPDGTADNWQVHEQIPTIDGRLILVFRPGRECSRVRVRYDGRLSLHLLGVCAWTPAAIDGANNANSAAVSSSNDLASRAAQPLAIQQNLLKPGKLYKIIVEQTVSGVRPSGAPRDFDPTTSSFFFRTAPRPTADVIRHNDLSHFIDRQLIYRKRDTFDPAYLERYLLGYTPLDKIGAWFCDDPVAVHFAVEYIGELATTYGREVLLRCRRTDTPPQRPEPWHVLTIADLVPLSAVHLASPVDRRLILGEASIVGLERCPLPVTGGASIVGIPHLEPGGAYDLTVAFPLPGEPESGNQLPGIVFTTSRWRNPRAMFEDLGFTDVAGSPTGDVPVTLAPHLAPGEVVADGAVEDALNALGLGRWPAPATARTTALWTSNGAGGWVLVGALLEAPEPIHRPALTTAEGDIARVTIGALHTTGGTFDIVRRNTSGTRHLYLATVPFTPTDVLVLNGQEQSVSLGGFPSAPVPFALRCAVEATPRFMEDL